MQATPRDNAGVIAPPPLLYAVPLLLGMWLHSQVPLPFSRRRQPILGGIFVGAGFTMGFLTVKTMRRVRTSPSPYDPVRELVTDGPFKVTRNPIYVGLTLIYTGIALLVNTLWPMLLLPMVLKMMRLGVIEREER